MANPPKSDANGSRSGILIMVIILGGKHYVFSMSSSHIRVKITTQLISPNLIKFYLKYFICFKTKTRM